MKWGSRNKGSKPRERARRMRREPSVAERWFWNEVRLRRLGGFMFKRQVPIGPYVLDFYCPEASLAVEVDGEQHEQTRDQVRDRCLLDQGIETFRIPSLQVFDPTIYGSVIEALLKRCQDRSRN